MKARGRIQLTIYLLGFGGAALFTLLLIRQGVASVATAFPTGLMPLRLKIQETRAAANDGAAASASAEFRQSHSHRHNRFPVPDRPVENLGQTRIRAGAA